MRIFISGGSGFLGRTLTQILNSDHEVLTRPHGKYYSGMLNGVDVVIHLAGLKRGLANDLLSANVILTQRLVDEAIRAKVQRFVFISTYCVYGYQPILPATEDAELHPVGNYALSKTIAEAIIRESGVHYTILRLSHVFGLNGDDIVNQMLKSYPIQINGNGSNTIDLIPLNDACHYISQLSVDDRTQNQIINIGSGQPRSIKQIATEISLWRGNAIAYSGLLETPLFSRVISISKLQSLVDINPASINNLIYDYVTQK